MFPGQKAESRVHVTEGGTLSIQSARLEDSGEYSCQALNAAGSSFANAHITVTGLSRCLSVCLHILVSLSDSTCMLVVGVGSVLVPPCSWTVYTRVYRR